MASQVGTLRLDKDLLTLLKVMCARDGTDPRGVVESLIRAHVEDFEIACLRPAQGEPYALTAEGRRPIAAAGAGG